MTLKDLKCEAHRRTLEATAQPELRWAVREAFYQRFGHGIIEEGYGNSELAFLRWEIERGVFNAVDGQPHGSAWWRKVNSGLIFDAALAELLFDHPEVERSDVPHPTRQWLTYLEHPSSQSWYRAHNASIVHGYVASVMEAEAEDVHEQRFMNMVLNRVLFAQAIVEGSPLAFGMFGEMLADPSLPAVDLLVALPDFYPCNYPLTPEDVADLQHRSFGLEEIGAFILDELLIAPRIRELYSTCAAWIGDHRLIGFLHLGEPDYPDITPT